ncbi:hypothetical protein AGMMS49579_21780 [Spirochaetia bacterium]|nr:hypothetical protein AGMMS49579_21780 [Spirochaetia bacterium]
MKKGSTVLVVLLLAVCGATGAFAQSESDFEITVENGAVTITGYTGNETAVVIPATIEGLPVTAIGREAFWNCTGLTAISIPASVTSIGYGAFQDCTSLIKITIPEGVTSIGDAAFYECSSLTSIRVKTNNNHYTSRNGVLFNKAGDELIAYPPGLKGQYAIPAGVTDIGSSAFSSCTGLGPVSIPASVTGIGNGAFSGCTSLTSIAVDTNSNHYTSRNGVLFNKAEDTLIVYPAGLKGQYAIPAGVTGIGSGAFSGCAGLTSIRIPASVTGIGDGAFLGCTGLTSVTIPAGITSIAELTFWKCTGLTSVNIPEGVTGIGGWAFWGCTGLTSVSIPASVTGIGNWAFNECNGLISVRIGANVEIGDDYFEKGFDAYYNANGKKAGLYAYRKDAWRYAAQ